MQNGIAPGLIHNGGVVKDSPGTSPVDLILQTTATPIIDEAPQVYTPINQTNVATVPTIDAIPNIANVPNAAAGGTNNTVVVIAAGLGALLLFSKEGKKAVEGITGIGKKKKNKSSMLPLLLVAGAGAYWYFNQTPATTTSSLTPPATNPPANDPTTTPTQAFAVPDPALAIQPLPNDTTIYNLLYAYSVPWRYGVDRMTAAEKQALYTYVFGYIKPGIHLYNYPGTYQDGFYNPQLYAEILQLSNKWNMGLLY